jgi:hypothetical protein
MRCNSGRRWYPVSSIGLPAQPPCLDYGHGRLFEFTKGAGPLNGKSTRIGALALAADGWPGLAACPPHVPEVNAANLRPILEAEQLASRRRKQ